MSLSTQDVPAATGVPHVRHIREVACRAAACCVVGMVFPPLVVLLGLWVGVRMYRVPRPWGVRVVYVIDCFIATLAAWILCWPVYRLFRYVLAGMGGVRFLEAALQSMLTFRFFVSLLPVGILMAMGSAVVTLTLSDGPWKGAWWAFASMAAAGLIGGLSGGGLAIATAFPFLTLVVAALGALFSIMGLHIKQEWGVSRVVSGVTLVINCWSVAMAIGAIYLRVGT